MSKPLDESERCQLFERIACEVWERIERAHRVNADLKEVGLTSDIIVDILNYNLAAIPNFKVFAQEGWQEKRYGSDIDIFVETDFDRFRWFALQAKILKKTNCYDTMRDTSDHVMQWLKLRRLETLSGCKAFYLLYNGKLTYSAFLSDSCSRSFSEDQFGCSLVELESIKNWVGRKSAGKRKKWIYSDPTFDDFHPADAQPWRTLVCCYQNKLSFRMYSLQQIEEASRNYEELSVLPTIEGKEAGNTRSVESDNPIVLASRQAKWSPGIRIVVQRTDNII